MDWNHLLHGVVYSIIFGALGIALFGAAFWFANRASHLSLKKELLEDQNTALAIVLGSSLIGIAMIISAAIG